MQPLMHKFPQIEHHEAAGELKDTFDDIQRTLRVAWVAFACRIVSAFPSALPMMWRSASPHFGTRYAERAADALRANALLPRSQLQDPRPKLKAIGWSNDKIRELLVTLDAFNYGNVKYLLLIAVDGSETGVAVVPEYGVRRPLENAKRRSSEDQSSDRKRGTPSRWRRGADSRRSDFAT